MAIKRGMWEVEHYRRDGTWVIPPEAKLSTDQASAALLKQLQQGVWNDDGVTASTLGRHVRELHGVRKLDTWEAGQEAERILLEMPPRAQTTGRDHVPAMRRAWFPHGC
eukprot:3219989-Rhodomonas_salina.1